MPIVQQDGWGGDRDDIVSRNRGDTRAVLPFTIVVELVVTSEGNQ